MKREHVFLFAFIWLLSVNVRGQSRVVDSLETIVQQNKQDIQENMVLNKLAVEYARTNMARAIECLHRSILLARKLGNPLILSNACVQMMTVQLNTGHADSAAYYLDEVRQLSLRTESLDLKQNYYFAAGLFYKIQGNYTKALPYMLEALKEVMMQPALPGHRASIAGENLNIGNVYLSLGNYPKALQFHLRSMKIFEEVNNQRGLSFCYQSIGSDFINLGQFGQALPYIEQSIALKKILNDQRGLCTGYEAIGTIYLGLARYPLALEFCKKSVEISRNLKLPDEEGKADFDIGKIYAALHDRANATIYFEKGKALTRQAGDSATTAAIDAQLASLRANQVRLRQTEIQLLNSLKTSLQMGDKSSELSNYKYLADYYTANRRFEMALFYSDKFHSVSDSIQNNELQLQIRKLEEQYNLEKKEKEITLLRKDQQLSGLQLQKNKVFQAGAVICLIALVVIGCLLFNRYRIISKNSKLIEVEKMRNHIARDLHDDIGSTLSSINIVSNTSHRDPYMADASIRADMKKINDWTVSILESMSDIVWTINPKNDSLDQMLFRMKEFANEMFEPLDIQYLFKEEGDFSEIHLDIGKRKDFYLFFKEVVNNTARHSHCRNVLVVLQRQQNLLCLTIDDDGRGFDEKKISRNGNGLVNMRGRVNSMKASMSIESNSGSGTRIKLTVPLT